MIPCIVLEDDVDVGNVTYEIVDYESVANENNVIANDFQKQNNVSSDNIANDNDIATNVDAYNVTAEPKVVDEPEIIELDMDDPVVVPIQVAMNDFSYNDIAEQGDLAENVNQNVIPTTSSNANGARHGFLRLQPIEKLLQRFYPQVPLHSYSEFVPSKNVLLPLGSNYWTLCYNDLLWSK